MRAQAISYPQVAQRAADRLIAAAVGLGDCHPKVVAADRAVSGKIDGHV